MFLSYSYRSAAVEAEALTAALRARGVQLLDHEWSSDRPTDEQVAERVAQADLIVVLVKPGDESRDWMEYETRLMLQTGWMRPELRVVVVAPAVGAIPPALRHQQFVSYFAHDEVNFSNWRDVSTPREN